METRQKAPHHMTKEYKSLKEKGLISECGKFIIEQKDEKGGVDENPNLDILGISTKPLETSQSDQANSQEPTVPLSEVKKMMEEMEERFKQNLQQPAPAQPQVYASLQPQTFDITDNIPEFKNWEVKEREYRLVNNQRPITRSIQRAHTKERALQYFNKETGKTHTMRYSSNQPSFFIENQSKEAKDILDAEIIFQFGTLKLGVEDTNLQKFLHIHTDFGVLFEEHDPSKLARQNIEARKLKNKAESLIDSVGRTMNRAIVSLETPHYIEAWTNDQVEEAVWDFVGKDPKKYIEYCQDPSTAIKGLAKTALAKGWLKYKDYKFYDENDNRLMEVDRNKNEFDEIANFFQSSDGRNIYEYLLGKTR